MTDIERLIDQFLAYIDVERGLAKATVRAYDSDLRKYNGWLATQGIQDLNAVTTQDVERYIAFLDDSRRIRAQQGTKTGQHSCIPSLRTERTCGIQ